MMLAPGHLAENDPSAARGGRKRAWAKGRTPRGLATSSKGLSSCETQKKAEKGRQNRGERLRVAPASIMHALPAGSEKARRGAKRREKARSQRQAIFLVFLGGRRTLAPHHVSAGRGPTGELEGWPLGEGVFRQRGNRDEPDPNLWCAGQYLLGRAPLCF